MSSALAKKVKDQPEGPEDFLTLEYVTVAAADEIIADHDIGAPVLAITRGYAYTNTALMALLVEARVQAGVLAPAQFAWLKLVDRNLWYAMHSLGFETEDGGHYLHPNPRAEAVGSRAHWAVERLAGRPLIQPEFGRALEALSIAAAPTRSTPSAPTVSPAAAASPRPARGRHGSACAGHIDQG